MNLVAERKTPDVLLVHLSGGWRQMSTSLELDAIRRALTEPPDVKALEFDTAGLTGWDSRFVASIGECVEMASGHHIDVRCEGLPVGVRRLLRLAQVLPGKEDLHRVVIKEPSCRCWGSAPSPAGMGRWGCSPFWAKT